MRSHLICYDVKDIAEFFFGYSQFLDLDGRGLESLICLTLKSDILSVTRTNSPIKTVFGCFPYQTLNQWKILPVTSKNCLQAPFEHLSPNTFSLSSFVLFGWVVALGLLLSWSFSETWQEDFHCLLAPKVLLDYLRPMPMITIHPTQPNTIPQSLYNHLNRPRIDRVDLQWLPMTINDYQKLSKTIKDYQRLSKSIKVYQRL